MTLFHMLKELFRKQKGRRNIRKSPSSLAGFSGESLEQRLVPTSMLYVDFGFGFTGGRFTISEADSGSVNGLTKVNHDGKASTPDVSAFGSGHTMISLLQSVQNRGIDLTGDGAGTLIDANVFADRVVATLQRAFEPFDVIVQQVSSQSMFDVRDFLSRSGGNDAYVFATGATPASIPGFLSASPSDAMNLRDNTAFVFTDAIIQAGSGFGSAWRPHDFPAEVAAAIGREAAHTFGLTLTSGESLLEHGDVMYPGVGGLPQLLVSRFTLDSLPGDVPHNRFDELAANVGRRPGGPDYVIGTGAFDDIQITRLNATEAFVVVSAYDDAAHTVLLRTTSYVVNTANGLVVEGGHLDDVVTIDPALTGVVTVRGGDGMDTVRVSGGAVADAFTVMPDRVTRGASTVSFQEVEQVQVDGLGGADTLTFDDSFLLGRHSYEISAGSLKVLTPRTMTVGLTSIETLNVTTSGGDDTVNVKGLAAGTALTLRTGRGDDVIIISGSLATPITVDAGEGTNDAVVGPNAAMTWTIREPNAGTLAGGTVNVTYSNVEQLVGGSMDDRFMFNNWWNPQIGTVAGGEGRDTLDFTEFGRAILVDLPTKSVRNSWGAIVVGAWNSIESVVGSNYGDTLAGDNLANRWNITSRNAGDVNGFSFSRIESLRGGSLRDTFIFALGAGVDGSIEGSGDVDTLAFTAETKPLTFNFADRTITATNGIRVGGFQSIESVAGGDDPVVRDTLIAPNTVNDWTLYRENSGSATFGAAAVSFKGIENLVGGADRDLFRIPLGSLTGNLNGGAGEDTLDYSSTIAGVTVDLLKGGATGVKLGVLNIENVTGGGGDDWLTGNNLDNLLQGGGGRDTLKGGIGNDILLGFDGDDRLEGGNDRDLLIGGTGVDVLDGGAGEDILIGGWTFVDGNIPTLRSMSAEWKRTDLPGTVRQQYDARVDRLSGRALRGLNLATFSLGGNVRDDGAIDSLFGGGDLDWFLASSSDSGDRDLFTERNG